MNLDNKLYGLPTVYYLNLDNRVDRKNYMETQFNFWGIKNYERVSATKYLASRYDEWKHLLSNERQYAVNPMYTANFISHIELIKNWLDTTNEEYMIMLEDDYDLSLIKYWNFDWEYLMNNIPYDWDCVQLGYESLTCIHFFLHPKIPATYFGACMINRYYAEKLIRLYIKNNKFIIDNEFSDIRHLQRGHARGTVDYSICVNGKTYCLPLIPQNPKFSSYENFYEHNSRLDFQHIYVNYELYHQWWKTEHYKFSLQDFFTYGKPNDNEMTKSIKLKMSQNKISYT